MKINVSHETRKGGNMNFFNVEQTKLLKNYKNKYDFLIGQQGYGKTYYQITKMLMKLNFDIKSIGFQYWVVALIIYKKNFYKYDNTIESVYSEVAKTFHTTRTRVERTMRTASEEAKRQLQKILSITKN